MSLPFVNRLANPAREFFLSHCSPNMPLDQIIMRMKRHFNSESRKLASQYEMDGLNLTKFMEKNEISDQSRGLSKLVDYVNALAPQLPQGFGDDAHKTR